MRRWKVRPTPAAPLAGRWDTQHCLDTLEQERQRIYWVCATATRSRHSPTSYSHHQLRSEIAHIQRSRGAAEKWLTKWSLKIKDYPNYTKSRAITERVLLQLHNVLKAIERYLLPLDEEGQ